MIPNIHNFVRLPDFVVAKMKLLLLLLFYLFIINLKGTNPIKMFMVVTFD